MPRIKAVRDKIQPLSKSEKDSIFETWRPLAGKNIELDYWKFYKTLMGGAVSALMVPDNLYWSKIIRTLNPISFTRTYTNKSLYPIIFKGLSQPRTLLNSINGIIYNGNMARLTISEAVKTIADSEEDIIIKPTRETSGGSGIKKIHKKSSPESIKGVLGTYGLNYICQCVVRQSPSTAIFNGASLNTFRVNTLNLNGTTTCECIMMRHGLKDSIVDNFAAGGIVCGMNTKGQFNGVGFNSKLERIDSLHDGMDYTCLSIPAIDKVISQAIDAHQCFMPHIGHAAWDFAIDENEKPVMIEVNLMLPGIISEQLSSGGSIFGERTEEVIEYAKERLPKISWTEFVGGW